AIEHDHIEGRGRRTLFIKTAYMEARCVRTAMDNLVNCPGVTMVSKHDRPISREVLNEGGFVQPMGVEEGLVQGHQVNNVDHAHLQFWQVLAQPPGRCPRFLCRNVTCTGQHDARFDVLIVTRPVPGRYSAPTMDHRLLHAEPVELWLLIDDDEIDVVA